MQTTYEFHISVKKKYDRALDHKIQQFIYKGNLACGLYSAACKKQPPLKLVRQRHSRCTLGSNNACIVNGWNDAGLFLRVMAHGLSAQLHTQCEWILCQSFLQYKNDPATLGSFWNFYKALFPQNAA